MLRLQVNSCVASGGSRTSWAPSAYRRFAGSCFSIDLFALQPTSRIRDRLSLQLQTTYARACSKTHTHLDCSQLLQDLTHLGGQMFPGLVQREEKFYSGAPKGRFTAVQARLRLNGKAEKENSECGSTIIYLQCSYSACLGSDAKLQNIFLTVGGKSLALVVYSALLSGALKFPPVLDMTHIPPHCTHTLRLIKLHSCKCKPIKHVEGWLHHLHDGVSSRAALPVTVWRSHSPNHRGPAWLWQSSWTHSSVFLPRGTWSARQLVSGKEKEGGTSHRKKIQTRQNADAVALWLELHNQTCLLKKIKRRPDQIYLFRICVAVCISLKGSLSS